MSSPTPASRGQIQPAFAIVLGIITVVAVVAAAVASRPPSPTVPASPSTPPSAAPTSAPSPAPSGGPLSVDLDNATGHDVSIKIHDESGHVVRTVSGKPADGMSVRWHEAGVKNVGARSIAITWAGLPGDDLVDLGIRFDNGTYSMTLVQAGPVPNSDAMGEDRSLVLTFDAPVGAKDVSIEVLDRTVD
jgi:hypothetical protein